ncbi:MAG TPA: prolyl oligopeptidase family serine peptidase [Gaiellaceae bacterium]
MRRLVLVALAAAALGGSTGAAAATRTWVGTFRLPAAAEATGIAVELSGGRAVVSMPVGHAARTRVTAKLTANRLRFTLPGRPAPLVFDGAVRGRAVVGSVRQGALRGTFRLEAGRLPDWGSAGVYGDTAILDTPWYPRQAIDLRTGEIHALYRQGAARYTVGAGFAVRAPTAGKATLTPDALVWRGARASRLPLTQEEVRFRSGDVELAGTLTRPAGPGRHPAVAIVHGGGAVPRAAAGAMAPYFASLGFVVLACDKRGVGQSGGRYPGDLASEEAIDVLAHDAEAAARFLAAQPEVDPSRVGLTGASQAGWIMPLAASREPAVRFLVLLVSPTLAQGAVDLYHQLTGGGVARPSRPLAEIEAQVQRTAPSGFDPMPAIRALRIPALWLYGGHDLTVPTRLCVEALQPLVADRSRDFTVAVLPGANHGLAETANGLDSEMLASPSLAHGLFADIREWLAARRLSG